MTIRRALFPLIAGLLGLLGSLAVLSELYRTASGSVESVLSARLKAAGESAALLLGGTVPPNPLLRKLVETNDLDGAYLVSADREVLADASGEPRARVDLLRTDLRRLRQAQAGEASIGEGYRVGEVTLTTSYFPVPATGQVLVLEAGKAFTAPRRTLQRALGVGVLLSLLAGGVLAFVAARWVRAERQQADARDRAARADVLSRMSAMAAHEIRNPLGVIRGTAELMRERLGDNASDRDRRGLADILEEVERLRLLTEDFMDLAADRPLTQVPLDLSELVEDASHTVAIRFPSIRFEPSPHPEKGLPVTGDPGRLHQVFVNLLVNAAQAQKQGTIRLLFQREGSNAVVHVDDEGPGIAPEIRERLFDPFVTYKEGGTGLGLALSRRLVERQGGKLVLVDKSGPGARFEVRLPLS